MAVGKWKVDKKNKKKLKDRYPGTGRLTRTGQMNQKKNANRKGGSGKGFFAKRTKRR